MGWPVHADPDRKVVITLFGSSELKMVRVRADEVPVTADNASLRPMPERRPLAETLVLLPPV